MEPGHEPPRPHKAHATIFRQEVEQAVEELRRPWHGQLISGLLAGAGVGFSVLLVAAIATLTPADATELVLRALIANAYAIGFVIVIMGRTDLFTEYTTIAILPVITRDARLASLARFWLVVYLGNLVGGALLGVALVWVGPGFGVYEPEAFGVVARTLVEHPWWVILIGATLAGWLMGMLSWLVTAARGSTSQIVFIWIVAGVIGFLHLPHAITGGIEALVAATSGQLTWAGAASFIAWTTLGNVVGGVVFAVLVRYSVLRSGEHGS